MRLKLGKQMSFTIGNKLMAGFIALSLIVVITGMTGLIMVKRVVRSTDIVLEEKVPVKDVAMEAIIASDKALNACKSYLLAETELKRIEKEIDEHIADFDMFISMVEYGTESGEFKNSPAGVRYSSKGVNIRVPRGDEEILLLLEEINTYKSTFVEKAGELVQVHKDKIQYSFNYNEVHYELPEFLQAADLVQRRKYQSLKDAIEYYVDFTGETEPSKTFFGAWYASYQTNDEELRPHLEDLQSNNVKFHEVLADIVAADIDQKESLLLRAMRYATKLEMGFERIEEYAYARIADLKQQEEACVHAMFDASENMGERFEQLEELADKGMILAQADAQSTKNFSVWILILLMPCAVSLALVLGFFITQGITKPILECVDFAKQVARGDLSKQVEIKSKDETRDLGDALNDMFGYLRGMADVADGIAKGDLSADVTPASDQDLFGNSFSKMIASLKQMVSRVRKSSESVASSAEEIAAATDQITKGAQNQASASEETGATMEEMSVQIQNVAKNAEGLASNVDETTSSIQQMGSTAEGVAHMAQSMATNVNETSSTIEQMIVTLEKTAKNVEEADKLSNQASEMATSGGKAVMKLVEGMNVIGDMMKNISGVIQNLGQRSEAIGSIVKVIEEIADQTNLLALNAAIEAARAGEAGQGFAVVADEVRKLAERSVKATKEIGDVIKQVQSETSSAVKATDEGARSSQEGLEIADQAGAAISRITEAVKATSNIMQEISSATAEQSAAAKNVVAAVEEMNNLTQSVTQSTNEQAAGVQQVVKAAESMSQMTEQVKNATSEQKKGGENVVKAIENISEIAKSNLSAVEQLSRSAKDMSQQSEGLQELVQEFKID